MFQFQALSSRRFQLGFDRANLHCPATSAFTSENLSDKQGRDTRTLCRVNFQLSSFNLKCGQCHWRLSRCSCPASQAMLSWAGSATSSTARYARRSRAAPHPALTLPVIPPNPQLPRVNLGVGVLSSRDLRWRQYPPLPRAAAATVDDSGFHVKAAQVDTKRGRRARP